MDFKTALPELEAWLGIPAIRDAVDRPQIVNSLLPPGFDIDSIPTKDITIYTYVDYDQNTILKIRRVVHANGKKDFYPEFPDGSKTIPEDYIRPLYNLPNINNADTVIVVEGEKCADYLNSLGLVATTNIGGASVPPEKTDWKPLEGKHIILWPDNDDAGVKHQKRTFDHIRKMEMPTIRLVQPPKNSDDKWDAADCEPKKVKQLLAAANVIDRSLNILAEEFSAKSYDEHPPKRQYLIEGGFALNSMSLLAAEGGTGKSFMFLDLAIKVAYGGMNDNAFGGRVMQSGNVVYLSAEDGRPDIHERINLVDVANPPRRFKDSKYELRIIPMPSLGVTFPLYYVKDSLLTESPNWSRIRESMLEMTDLKLIILDPLSMLVHADVNSDPSMGSLVCAEFNRLAVETNSAVLVSHHFSKGNYDTPIETPEQARQHVRGTTALVDSARNVFCVWKSTKEKAEETCSKLGILYQRDLIYRSATVKSNYLTENSVKTLKKNQVTGVLECVEEGYESSEDRTESRTIVDEAIKNLIRMKVAKKELIKKPKTGAGSMEDMDLGSARDELRKLPDSLKVIVDDLVLSGDLVEHENSHKVDISGGELHKEWEEKGELRTILK